MRSAENREERRDTIRHAKLLQERLLHRGRRIKGVCHDVADGPQRQIGMEDFREVGVEVVPQIQNFEETLDQFLAKMVQGHRRLLIFEQGRPGKAVELRRGGLLNQSDTLATKKKQVESTVGKAIVLDDPPDAADLVDRNGLEARRASPDRARLDHRDEVVVLEGILGHLAVSRLEDVQGQDDVGEKDDVRQREEPDPAGEIVEIGMDVHDYHPGVPPVPKAFRIRGATFR